ncbi:hypothetical protein LEM8419_00674 [Neolewinella maritima]|uniref:Uncharacterized protein n=1 Tax=Neolewinella maritima TaxID=1383882 RepID=A0ABM9AYU5_9BACT|nr:hypothetical protein LEM8419_00674 [Neolewinella maritima]
MYNKINPFVYAALTTVGLAVASVLIKGTVTLLEVILVFLLSSVLFYLDYRRSASIEK